MSPAPPYKPAYQVVVDDIREQIKTGQLRPGDQLPVKRELAAKYQVSGQVIDTAMLILRRAGDVQGRQGKGVFVAQREPGESGKQDG